MELCTVGYIRLLRLFNDREPEQFPPEEKFDWVLLSVKFGMPLLSPTMCNDVCRRLVSSELFQSGSFMEDGIHFWTLRLPFQKHLGGAVKVLLVTNDKENKRKASEEGICAETVESYVKSLDRPDLLDLLVRPSSEDAEMEDVEDHHPRGK
ncbi:hypothetical protein KIW84_045418 [Lathyrus oleraceus]|uniref:Uncharacterized protein n=1 Tax=Pisum sativum TaxID=3888 RepID=A0A9D5AX71_PEA|nr:hypothetical protein KIW84_045418 [Pisum sativum]